ncbi:MAG TPA: DUF455 family protein [Planctomycetes bacterium]|nr:DUF455 family protein [Planctomycetota bacterium]
MAVSLGKNWKLEPPLGTAERWALDYIRGEDLEAKLRPGRPPMRFEEEAVPRRVEGPGRPACLEVRAKVPRSLRPGALRSPEQRRRLLHTFLHHEMQAAELFCWAFLAFPEAPERFRLGLLAICLEECAHMRLYEAELRARGGWVGEFPVRDWFWERIPTCRTALSFVSLMGLGLEGANLDHAARFAGIFREHGDESGARVQEKVGRDEIRHVRFAAKWFRDFGGRLDFDAWAGELPAPLTPRMLRGRPLNRGARGAAGLPPEFLDALEGYE